MNWHLASGIETSDDPICVAVSSPILCCMYGCRTLDGVLGKLQTERGSPNAATTIAVGNVDAESCLEDEVPLLGRIPGVISVCLGPLPGGTSCALRSKKANWESGEVRAIAVGAEAP